MFCVFVVVVDVPTGSWFFSHGVLNRTPSHMWQGSYLPMFILRVGLFTIIKMNSFITLAKSSPSLPTMWKLSSVVVWPCSLNLSSNVLADSPMYSSMQSSLLHLYQCLTNFFVVFHPDPWGLKRCSWVFCCPWNMPGCHMYHKYS